MDDPALTRRVEGAMSTMEAYFYATLTLAIGLSMILGANNFSTCLGASLGARIIKPLNAIMIASAGLLLGTLLEGYKLSKVLGGQILPTLSAAALLNILSVSLLIMLVVTVLRLPLSLSQVAVGAAWGLGLSAGTQVTSYSISVLVSWILSPVLAFLSSAVIEGAVLRVSRKANDVIALNRFYGYLTLAAGFYAAYALGANTVGLVVGLFPAGIMGQLFLSVVFSLASILGMFFLSGGTVRSVAENLVGLNPSTALSAQFGGALSAHLFTQLGLPVSISQVAIGGMGGAASVKRVAIMNRRLLQQIIAGWTIGPMAGAALSFLLANAIRLLS